MPNQLNSGARDFFQTIFFLQGCISILFLQGRKSKLAQITGTIIIFKPLKNKRKATCVFQELKK